jgi:hypothetical protein
MLRSVAQQTTTVLSPPATSVSWCPRLTTKNRPDFVGELHVLRVAADISKACHLLG